MLLSLLRCERFVSLCVGLLITQFIFLDITQHQLHVNKKTTKVEEMAFSKTIAIKFSRRLKTMKQVPTIINVFPNQLYSVFEKCVTKANCANDNAYWWNRCKLKHVGTEAKRVVCTKKKINRALSLEYDLIFVHNYTALIWNNFLNYIFRRKGRMSNI